MEVEVEVRGGKGLANDEKNNTREKIDPPVLSSHPDMTRDCFAKRSQIKMIRKGRSEGRNASTGRRGGVDK